MKEEAGVISSQKTNEVSLEPPLPLKRVFNELYKPTTTIVANHTDQHINNVDTRGNHHDSHANHGGSD